MPSSGISKLLEVCYAEATRALLQGRRGAALPHELLRPYSELLARPGPRRRHSEVNPRSEVTHSLLRDRSAATAPRSPHAGTDRTLLQTYSRFTPGRTQGTLFHGRDGALPAPGLLTLYPEVTPTPRNPPHSHPASLRIACPSPRPSPLYRYRVYMGGGAGGGAFYMQWEGSPKPLPHPIGGRGSPIAPLGGVSIGDGAPPGTP